MPSNLHFQKAPQLALISLISDDPHEAQQSELLAQSLKGGWQASRQASFLQDCSSQSWRREMTPILPLAMWQGSAYKCYWLTKWIHGPHSLGPSLIWLYPRNDLNSLYLVKSSPGHPERVESVRGFVLLCFCFWFYVWRVHFRSLQRSLFLWEMDREETLSRADEGRIIPEKET